MKITKSQLKQIIKEEIGVVLNEVSMDDVHKLFAKYDLPEEEEQLVVKAAEQAVLNKDKAMFDKLPANLKAAAEELININMQLRKGI